MRMASRTPELVVHLVGQVLRNVVERCLHPGLDLARGVKDRDSGFNLVTETSTANGCSGESCLRVGVLPKALKERDGQICQASPAVAG